MSDVIEFIIEDLKQRNIKITTDISAKIVNMLSNSYRPDVIVETITRGQIKIPSTTHTLESYAKFKAREISLDDNDLYNPINNNNSNSTDAIDNTETIELKNKLQPYDIKSLFGQSLYKTRKLFNETALYTYRYVALDTSNSNGYDFITKKYKWNYNGTPLVGTGLASSTGPIKNIVGMRAFPLVMKNFSTFRDLYNIYTLTIDELISQSFIGHEKQRYHFMFRTRNMPFFGISDSNEFNPHDFNRGYFWFRTPIKTLSSFTISMANPVQAVEIPAGFQTAVINNYVNPLEINFGDYPHGLLDNNIVIVSNFTTNNTVADAAIIAAVNSSAGHVVTVIDEFKISIPIDGTLVTAPREVVIQCFDTANKTIFAFEFICEKEELPGDDSFL